MATRTTKRRAGAKHKGWFDRCVSGVKKSGSAVDPEAVCGSVLKRKRGQNPEWEKWPIVKRFQGTPRGHGAAEFNSNMLTAKGIENVVVESPEGFGYKKTYIIRVPYGKDKQAKDMMRKRNPESASASMYSSFHGTPSTAIDEYEEQEHYHSNLAALGELVGLKVRTVSGYDVTLGFESARASNPRRRPNLWPFDVFGKHTTIYHVGPPEKKGKAKKVAPAPAITKGPRTVGEFRGQKIEKHEQGFSAPGIDPDIYFDRKDDVKLFIASMLGGGKLKKNPLLEGREVRCQYNPKGKHKAKSPTGPFNESGEFVGNLLSTAYAPVGDFIGGTATALDRGLASVGIKESKGKKRKRNPDHVLLCSTEDGNNLQLVGGDQSLNLDSLKIETTKELVTVGEVWGLNYRTEKVFGDGGSEDGLTEYIHILGPKETKPPRGGDLWQDAVPPKDDVFGTGELPTLVFDKRNQKILLSGGIYHIDQPLMGTSAGIEH